MEIKNSICITEQREFPEDDLSPSKEKREQACALQDVSAVFWREHSVLMGTCRE